jgi:hypothetical protein
MQHQFKPQFQRVACSAVNSVNFIYNFVNNFMSYKWYNELRIVQWTRHNECRICNKERKSNLVYQLIIHKKGLSINRNVFLCLECQNILRLNQPKPRLRVPEVLQFLYVNTDIKMVLRAGSTITWQSLNLVRVCFTISADLRDAFVKASCHLTGSSDGSFKWPTTLRSNKVNVRRQWSPLVTWMG